MYNENYKTLQREIKENKWKHISRRFNKIKMSVLPRASYRFNVIPFKIPKFFFFRKEKPLRILRDLHGISRDIYMESQETPNNQTILKNKSKAGGLALPGFKTCYKATDIKAV